MTNLPNFENTFKWIEWFKNNLKDFKLIFILFILVLMGMFFITRGKKSQPQSNTYNHYSLVSFNYYDKQEAEKKKDKDEVLKREYNNLPARQVLFPNRPKVIIVPSVTITN